MNDGNSNSEDQFMTGPWASLTVRTDAPATPYSKMILGGILEHFWRRIYGGAIEQCFPLSDRDGFRKDVMAALRELKTRVVRWAGGCFVSGYWNSPEIVDT